jgi:hypothetical protein
VLVTDLLQSILNKAKEINVGYTNDFPIIQYADDTLLVMEACPHQLMRTSILQLQSFLLLRYLALSHDHKHNN